MGWFEHVEARVAVRICALTASVLVGLLGSSARAQAQQSAPPPTKRWIAPPPDSNGPQPPAASEPRAPGASLPWRETMERESPSPEAKARDRIWYGWQTLIADGLSLGLIAVSLGEDEADVALVGVGLLTIASPLVHFVQENTQGGLISLGIRGVSVGLFVLGGVLLADSFFDDSSSNDGGEFVGGVLLIVSLAGELAAISVDASLLAFRPKHPSRRQSATGVAPWIDPRRGSYGLRFGLAL
jgi:hypothetical protein